MCSEAATAGCAVPVVKLMGGICPALFAEEIVLVCGEGDRTLVFRSDTLPDGALKKSPTLVVAVGAAAFAVFIIAALIIIRAKK